MFLQPFLLTLLFALLLPVASAEAPSEVPSPDALAPHPRLLLRPGRVEELRRQIDQDPFSQQLWAEIKTYADELRRAPLLEYKVTGRRMLSISRDMLTHALVLGLVARVTGEPDYREAVVQQALAAAAFPVWNPSHFLDTAEMTTAVALVYDWFYDALTPAERQTLEQAIIRKGLEPSFVPGAAWHTMNNNWSSVCHSGLSLGALAVAAVDPALATRVLERAAERLPGVSQVYGDGGYMEGPAYWVYGTQYLVLRAAALETATGRPFDFDRIPGVRESVRYMRHATGPTGQYFNHGDGSEHRAFLPAMFYFAWRFGQPALTASDRRLVLEGSESGASAGLANLSRMAPLALIWHRPAARTESPYDPLVWMAHGAMPIAFLRTSWEPEATFIGIKGGSSQMPHGHQDIGSFVLDAAGVRWAVDLPVKRYEPYEAGLGGGFWDFTPDSPRWRVFRLSAEGHSVLRFNGQSPAVGPRARLERLPRQGALGAARIDLSPLYGDAASRVTRDARLWRDGRVELHDRWRTRGPAQVEWQMITPARVVTTERGARLELKGRVLELEVVTPSPRPLLRVDDVSSAGADYEPANPGISRLVLVLTTPADAEGELRVRFTAR